MTLPRAWPGKARGALIADVTKTGPAEKAGIEPGDVVIEFNGKPVNAMRDLRDCGGYGNRQEGGRSRFSARARSCSLWRKSAG